MFNFLTTTICGIDSDIQPVWNLVGTLVTVIMVGVPILLIIFGMIDLGKAVVASKEDEVKKATKLLGKRFLYAVGVFAIVWIVTFIFDQLADVMTGTMYENDTTWKSCWKCNIRGGKKAENCNVTDASKEKTGEETEKTK